MNLRSFRLRAIGPPLAVAAISVAALAWFDRIWIPTQQQYVNERNLRALRTISTQIKAKVDNFDQAIDHAIDSFPVANADDGLLQKYVKLFSPELEIVTLSASHSAWAGVTPGNPPNVRIQRDEGHNYLYLGYRHEKEHRRHPSTTTLIARGDLDKVTEAPLGRNDFDALLLLDGRGTTIAQQSTSGLELTSLSKINDRGGTAASGRTGVFERIRGTTGLAVVTVGAADYMLYTQPVQLSLVHDPKDGGPAPEEWTLCGMVRLDRFRAASSTIPTTYWLCFGAILVLICFAIPLVKLQVLSPRERLTRFDSISISAAVFVLMALAAFTAQDLRTFGSVVPAAIDAELRHVADSMIGHVRLETNAVDRQMKAFSRDDLWQQPLGYAQEERHSLDEIRTDLATDRHAEINLNADPNRPPCEPSWSCRLGLLKRLGDAEVAYPFFKLMVWNDAEGWQRIKWSASRFITPFINVADAKLSYFNSLKLARRLWLSTEKIPHDGVAVITSPNTGEKLTVFWRALAPLQSSEARSTSPAEAKQDLTGVTLATVPVSLTNPVLPKHVQFAVVDRSGRVLFHSDPSRGLAENVFQECEDNPALKSLIASRDSGAITARYLGRTHRMFVAPLDVAPFGDPRWTLVVFQTSAVSETANLQTVNLGVSMFIVYALGLSLCWALLAVCWPDAVRSVCWPAAARAPTYRHASAIGAAAGLACVSAPALMPASLLVPATATLVVGALIAMAVTVHRGRQSSASSPTPRADFLCARASLLFLLAAVPATLCFHLAFAFHSDLVTKRGQSHLASELGARARRINQQAQNVALCTESDPGWQECGEVATFVARRADATLWDIDVPSAPATPVEARRSREAAVVPEALRSFLRLAYRPYNDIAADLLLVSGSRPRPGTDQRQLAIDANRTDTLRDGAVPSRSRFVGAIASRPAVDRAPWLIALALASLAYALVRYLLRPIFGLDLRPAPLLLAAAGRADDTNLLVDGPSGARRTERLLRHPRVRVFDVRSLSFVDEPIGISVADSHAGAAADCGLGDQPQGEWRDAIFLAASHPLTIVAVDHLEHRLDDAAFRVVMLECLESLIYRDRATVWCSSNRDPIQLLDEVDAPLSERYRWSRVFESFRREHLGLDVDDQRSSALAGRLGKYSSVPRDVQSLIVSECEVAAELLAIGENLVDRLPPITPLSREDALTEIDRSAQPFYRELWHACAIDEKLALLQLADEGLINPNNAAAIARLLSVGLVHRGQTCRLMNETFRRFVVGAESHDVVAAWEREGVRLPWGTIATTGLTVAFGLAGLLLLTQEQLVDAWISYVPALAPAIPTMLKVLASAQKGRIDVTA